VHYRFIADERVPRNGAVATSAVVDSARAAFEVRGRDRDSPRLGTKFVHVLDGMQLDVEVGYTVVGSHVQWSASLSHNGKALGVVINGGTFFLLNAGSRFDVGSGVAAAAQRKLGLMRPELRAKMRA